MTANNRAIFLDRDGTLNRDTGFTHGPDRLELLDRVPEALCMLSQAGYRLFITTNQSGIGRGYYSEQAMHEFHAALLARLRGHDIAIAGIYFCPFHPEGTVERYRRDSPLRKPAPGMILAAAKEHDIDLPNSFAIGDKKADVAAGHAAGCRAILVQTGAAGGDDVELAGPPDYIATDLLEAAHWIVRGSSSSH